MLEPKRAGLLSSAPPSLAALTSNELSGGQLLSHALIIFGRHWSLLWRIEDCGRESPLPGTRGSRMCVPAKSLQSCPTLCNPMDSSPPCSSVHGILQARILEWVSMPSSRDLPNPGIEPGSPALQPESLLSEPPGKPYIHI